MPRYYFHIYDGRDVPDRVGTVLNGLAEAKREAVKVAGMLLQHDAEEFWTGEEWRMEVTDENNVILFTLDFTATVMPATGVLFPPDRRKH